MVELMRWKQCAKGMDGRCLLFLYAGNVVLFFVYPAIQNEMK